MASNLWLRFLRAFSGKRSASRPRSERTQRRPRRTRLQMEILEDRLTPSVFTWDGVRDTDGAVVDNNWTTAANWVGDVAPSAGDTLVFPSGVPASRQNTVNDFKAGTPFSILVSGAGYTLGGNEVALQNGLQVTADSTTVNTPLQLLADQSISESTGTLTLGGAVDLNGHTLTLDTPAAIDVQQAISGSGSLVKSGSGTATLGVANSYTGGTTVNGGTLSIQDAGALGTADGTATTGITLNNYATLQLDGSFTVSGELLMVNNGTLNSQGNSIWTGNINSSGTLYLTTSSGQSLQVSGNVSSSGSNYVQGSGTVTLSGTNSLGYLEVDAPLVLAGTTNAGTVFGGYSYSNGSLEVDGSLSTSNFNFQYGRPVKVSGTLTDNSSFYASALEVDGSVVLNGSYGNNVSGPLSGTGSVTVNNGQTLVAGAVTPGQGTTPGTLQTGSISVGGTFTAELDGDTAGSGYDQLQVAGSVTLSGANLQVNLGYVPALNTVFTLIDNDGSSDAVSGTFNGLPEGSLVTVNGLVFRLSYKGGDGNDVTLTRINAFFWDGAPDGGGASTDSNWSTASNWVGDVAPTAGATLVFPTGPTQLNTVNDFAADTPFSILVSGAGYTLGGNEVALQNGLQVTADSTTVNTPLQLLGDQSISESSGTLTLGGAIDLNGHTLTLDTPATIDVQQAISGSGSLIKSGGGTVVLGVADSYTGGTTVNGGTLSIEDAGALGTADGTATTGTTLNNYATLQLDGSFTVSGELLTVNNGTLNSQGNSIWTGNINSSGTLYLTTSSGQSLQVSGNVSSSGSNYVQGSGTVTLSGTNSLGYLEVDAPLVLAGTTNAGTVFGGYSYSNGSLEVDGSLSTSNFNFQYGRPVKVSGTLTDNSSFYASALEVDGSVVLNGSYGDNVSGPLSGTGSVTVNNGKTLVAGAVTPGQGTTPGTLQTGSISVGGTFTAELNGDTAGSGYDQLQVTGSVTLNGASLQVNLGYLPAPGTVFTLIANDGSSDAVSGTFTGLPEGSLVTQDGGTFRLSYQGGDGNDVTLTLLDLNHAPTLTPAQPNLGKTDADTGSTIALSSFINNGPGTTGITDQDTNNVLGGIVLTGATGAGTWYYSLDGVNFSAVGKVSDSQALLLSASAQLRYQPDPGTGETATITYRAWDKSSGVAGTTVDASHNGIATPYSAATDTASLNVTAVSVTDASGTYNGQAFTALASVNGVSSLEGVSPAVTYYVGSYSTLDALDAAVANGLTGSSTAPIQVGNYTVMASFAGSSDYASARALTTFSIDQAMASVSVTGVAITYDGNGHAAEGMASGVESPTPADLGSELHLAYTTDGGRTFSTAAPLTAGTYEVYYTFDGDTNYQAVSTETDSGQAVVIGQASAVITINGASVSYDGNAHGASGTASGVESTPADLGSELHLAYSTDGGRSFSNNAPVNAGTYEVYYTFDGDTNYRAITTEADSGQAVTIGQAAPTVQVSDAGGVYNSSAFPATATVNGGSSLENVPLTLAYYSGTYTLSTLPSSGGSSMPPTQVGSYTVVASFAGSTDYASASALATFTIGQATPTVSVVDAGGTYNGSTFPATGTAVGVDDHTAVSGSFSYTYALVSANATSSSAPSNAGSYTVIAHFTSSDPNYQNADSAAQPFTIQRAVPTVSVSGVSVVYDGQVHGATAASVVGINGTNLGSPTLAYYDANGTRLAGPPVDAGTYTVVASFAGNANYQPASQSATITIARATLTVTIDSELRLMGQIDPGSFTYSIGGFVAGQNLFSSGVVGSPVLSTNATNGSGPGFYTIFGGLGSLQARNYNFTFVPGSLHVVGTGPAPGSGMGIGWQAWLRPLGRFFFRGSRQARQLAILNGLHLRDARGKVVRFHSYADFRSWVLRAHGRNTAYLLSAELALVQLSVQNGFLNGNDLVAAPALLALYPGGNSDLGLSNEGLITVNNLVAAATTEVGQHPFTPVGSPSWAYQMALVNTLGQVNNDTGFVQ